MNAELENRGEDVPFRHAKPADAAAIAGLIAERAPDSSLLPVSTEEAGKRIHEFVVAEIAGKIVGCLAMKDYGDGLVEIRSLAVAGKEGGRGIGSKLVRRAIRDHIEHDGKDGIFALTSKTEFFERLGFRVVEKERFPKKIWNDCDKCAKKDHCDELAVLLEPDPER